MKLKIKKLHPDAVVPTRGSAEAAALDIYALEGGMVRPGEVELVRTGIAVEFPTGNALLVTTRSSHGARYGLGVPQGYGLIDADYRGAIFVPLSTLYEFRWSAGDRIAQMMLVPIIVPELEVVEELTTTERGTGGFGSTGGVT